LAKKIDKPHEYQPTASTELELDEESDSAEIEAQAIFRRKIAGLRRLPRRQRAQALREAREWLAVALQALREKKATARHARYMLWQMKCIRPSGFDHR
jgi:hypothetical protein